MVSALRMAQRRLALERETRENSCRHFGDKTIAQRRTREANCRFDTRSFLHGKRIIRQNRRIFFCGYPYLPSPFLQNELLEMTGMSQMRDECGRLVTEMFVNGDWTDRTIVTVYEVNGRGQLGVGRQQ
jgi:hypothetical protein